MTRGVCAQDVHSVPFCFTRFLNDSPVANARAFWSFCVIEHRLVPSWCTSSWKSLIASDSLIPFVPEHLPGIDCLVVKEDRSGGAPNASLKCQPRTRGGREVSMKKCECPVGDNAYCDVQKSHVNAHFQACLQQAGGLNQIEGESVLGFPLGRSQDSLQSIRWPTSWVAAVLSIPRWLM